MSNNESTFGQRRRKMKTPWTVRGADVASEGIITVGGIGTIVAVCLVALVLFMEVLPLLRGASVTPLSVRQAPWQADQIVHFQLNEYQTMGWLLTRDGTLQTVRLRPPVLNEDNAQSDTPAEAAAPGHGSQFEVVHETRLVEGPEITAISTATGQSAVVLGLADGTVRVGSIRFETTFIDPIELKDWYADQPGGQPADRLQEPGDTAVYRQGVVQMTIQGQYRLQTLAWEMGEPISLGQSAIRLLDQLPPAGGGESRATLGGQETILVAQAEDGTMALGVVQQRRDLMTGDAIQEQSVIELPPADLGQAPRFLRISALGRYVYAAAENGRLARYDIRNKDAIRIVETVDLLPDSDARLTACGWILGRETLFCGDSQGNLSGWFPIRLADRRDGAFDDRESADGFALVRAHRFSAGPGAVTAFGASSRSRMFAVGYEGGECSIYHMTTEKHVAELPSVTGASVSLVQMAPRDDGILVGAGGTIAHYGLEPGYPDITLGSLFLPVWYEGYAQPISMWQSSSSKMEDELKFSLLPLIFGTVKATFYSLLFGAPIAFLAAVYTSEFSTKETRMIVKPTVEMMASLPSVVLGFVAALVFAPVVEQIVPAFLAAVFVLPLVLLLGAFLWQLLPRPLIVRLHAWRLALIVPALLLGIWLSLAVGPLVEKWLFMGDLKVWLVQPDEGTGIGGWLLILLPAAALAMLVLDGYGIGPVWRGRVARLPRLPFSLAGLGKFLLLSIATLLLALAVASLFELVGWDPRGTFIGEYDQRNSLIVGFVMGFAVIPIIYTIADDALTTVPAHLRSASLGCGATRWQTALRVVIPTAMSGLFSALMIGLGRVAGETMIVLMAGGNTPVQDWNIFNGFRTLSTNIAIELPEAVQGGGHYRVLFLSALVLFLLTFLINTVAEAVRLYFRRRAHQL